MPIQRDETHSAHADLLKFFKLAEKKVMQAPMTRLPAKVLFVDRLVDQYLVTVKVSENHRGKFDKLNFGEKKPQLGSYRNGWLDLAYHQNPNLKAGQSFPLWAIQQTTEL